MEEPPPTDIGDSMSSDSLDQLEASGNPKEAMSSLTALGDLIESQKDSDTLIIKGGISKWDHSDI